MSRGGGIDYTTFDLPRTITAGNATTKFLYDAFGTRVQKNKTATGSSGYDKTTYVGGVFELRESKNLVRVNASSTATGLRPSEGRATEVRGQATEASEMACSVNATQSSLPNAVPRRRLLIALSATGAASCFAYPEEVPTTSR